MKHYCQLATGTLSAIALVMASPASAGETEAALAGAVLGNILGSKTTLEDDAGKLEGTVLGSRLLLAAGKKITSGLAGNKGLLLVDNEDINLGLARDVETLMKWHLAQISTCPAPKTKKADGDKAIMESFWSEVAGVIKDAPKPSTTIHGYELTVPESALVAAIQAHSSMNWARIADVLIVPEGNRVAKLWDNLQVKRSAANTNDCSQTDAGKARIAAFDEFAEEITAIGEKGAPSLLLQAERISQVLGTGADLKILRVKVEAAGGSVINSDNLLTRLGVPAITLTGAAVVSYRLIDPTTGMTSASDIIVCTAPKHTLKAVQKGKLSKITEVNCIDKSNT